MKKVVLAFFISFVAFFTGCKEDSKLVVATAAEFPPFEFKEGKEFKGIDMEIAQAIAKELGMELEIQDMEFDSVISAISSGNVDFGISGLTINETRSKVVDFSTPYYNAAQVVIAKKNSSFKFEGDNPEKLKELIANTKGIKIGVATGTTGAFYANGNEDWGFDGFANAEVKSFVNGSLAVNALVNGVVDIVILDEAPANILSKANDSTYVINSYLTEEQYGIAVKKGNKELLDKINIALKNIQDSGTLDNIIKKYM